MTGSTPSPRLCLCTYVHNQSFMSLSQDFKVQQAVGESIPTECSRMRTFTDFVDGDDREGTSE